jgi:hypothetical protein
MLLITLIKDVLNAQSNNFCSVRAYFTATKKNKFQFILSELTKIFSFNAAGGDRSPGVWRYPSERYIHWRYDPNNSGADFGQTSLNVGVGGTQFALSTWFYIGVTKNGATATSYVNGVSLGTSAVSSPKTAGNAAITLFPYYTSGLAELGCVHVYNTVLTASQVAQNFNAIRGRYGI